MYTNKPATSITANIPEAAATVSVGKFVVIFAVIVWVLGIKVIAWRC